MDWPEVVNTGWIGSTVDKSPRATVKPPAICNLQETAKMRHLGFRNRYGFLINNPKYWLSTIKAQVKVSRTAPYVSITSAIVVPILWLH